MQVAHLHAEFLVILRQVFGHPLGQRRDQHPLAARRTVTDFSQQIVDLTAHGPHFDHRIEQAGGADDLLHDDAPGLAELVRTGRSRYEHQLADARLPLVEVERTVVERRGQAESVRHEHFLP